MSQSLIALTVALVAALALGPLTMADEPPSDIHLKGFLGSTNVDLTASNPFPRPEANTISVSGTGRVSAAPDVAEINLGVVNQGKTAREALSANNEAMAALHATLKERGVAAKDIQTTQINIQPQYSQPRPPGAPSVPSNLPRPVEANEPFVPKIIGYQVSNTVQVTARDLAKLGTLLDAVVQAGANQMHGISFRIDKPESILEQARKTAMADARRKAELLAGEAGVVLGPPIRIQESEGRTPSPQPRARTMAFAASAVPVAAGEQELSVTVDVVYRLRLPK